MDELVKNDNILHLVQSQRLDNVRCCKYYALDICKFPDMIHRENSYVHDRWTSHVCHICKSALQVMADHPAIRCQLLAKLDEKAALVQSSAALPTATSAWADTKPSLDMPSSSMQPSTSTSFDMEKFEFNVDNFAFASDDKSKIKSEIIQKTKME